MKHRIAKTLAAAGMVALLASTTASAAPMYTITDLGDLGHGTYSFAYDINDGGQVVGESYFNGPRAFLWQNGIMTDLGLLPGGGRGGYITDGSIAHGINNNGQVVGRSVANGVTAMHGFLWQNGIMTDIGDVGTAHPFYSAFEINDSGQVVGTAPGGGFIWDSVNGRTALPGVQQALDINNSGQVAGHGRPEDVTNVGVLWDSVNGLTALRDLQPVGDRSVAHGINDLGQAVGSGFLRIPEGQTFNPVHALMWDSDAIIDLGILPGGAFSVAEDINNSGQVVGHVSVGGNFNAFIWDNTIGMLNLNDLLVDPGNWKVDLANAINASGQIVGRGQHNGAQTAFLLTPVAGTMANNPLLPDTGSPDGLFEFTFESDLAGGEDEMIFIDPLIAIGYDYIVTSGPNIASVLLPTILSDDGLYDIYLWDGDGFDIFAGIAEDGVAFDFTALAGYSAGVNRFRVLGIDEAAMLDPTLNTAFVTGLTFVSGGTVVMSQTPVTFDTDAVNPGPTGVPEPMAVTLLGAGLFGLGWMRRRG